jgi:phosphopantothenoylcysteine synthetase/decarboxylase
MGQHCFFGHEKLHLREHGHPVQQVKVNKSQRLTSDEVLIFSPRPKVFTGDNGCVKHCNIIKDNN